MKTKLTALIAAVIFTAVTALSEEPAIKGKLVAYAEQSSGPVLVVDYTTGRKLKRGDRIAVEWGDGNYYATVIQVNGPVITTDYYPTSVEVESGASVKVVKGAR